MSTLTSSRGRTTPCQRLDWLCDPGSLAFDETATSRGAVGARGCVGGRSIVCYAQDSSVAGGAVGVAEAETIVSVLRRGRELNVPVVGLIESGGARLQEGAGALGGFGRIFFENVALSGHAPQISVITGTSAGGGCYSPALTDFVVMSRSASMFLTGPRIVRHALGEDVTATELGGPEVHQRNGVCDFLAPDDRSAIAMARDLLGYLPQNASERPPVRPTEAPQPGDPGDLLPHASRSYYEVRDVMRRLVDGGRILEVSPRWARNMVTALARLEGHPVGVIANQSRHLGGIIDVAGSQKAAKFIRTCASFRLPLLVLVDTPGFMPGTHQESAGVIRYGADLVRAFAATTSPRVSVILRKAFGGAFIAMNSRDLGADAAYSWPNTEIGVMSSTAAVEIIHRRQLQDAGAETAGHLANRYAEEHLTPHAALRRGAIDAVIEPGQTRSRAASVLLGAGAA
jgi:acetyl-CoA carboxylase carboxyltransferase component